MERAELEQAEKIFETGVSDCDFAHEDVHRTRDGLAIIPAETIVDLKGIMNLILPQCDKKGLPQHFGCPHFFSDVVAPAGRSVINALIEQKDIDVYKLDMEMRRIALQLIGIDKDMQYARWRSIATEKTPEDLYDLKRIPTAEVAAQKAAEPLQRYTDSTVRIENFRIMMLGKIRMLLKQSV